MRAWEYVEEKQHRPRTGTSGATDANILRSHGIPTARLGMPRQTGPQNPRARFSMDSCNVSGMKQLTKCLIYAAIDTCTRERGAIFPTAAARP
jgi:hypothetical protein